MVNFATSLQHNGSKQIIQKCFPLDRKNVKDFFLQRLQEDKSNFTSRYRQSQSRLQLDELDLKEETFLINSTQKMKSVVLLKQYILRKTETKDINIEKGSPLIRFYLQKKDGKSQNDCSLVESILILPPQYYSHSKHVFDLLNKNEQNASPHSFYVSEVTKSRIRTNCNILLKEK